MENVNLKLSAAITVLLFGFVASARGEEPYDFRAEMAVVHQRDVRDSAAKRAVDEVELREGAVLSIPAEASDFVFRAAQDFQDYLAVSMDVNVRIARGAGDMTLVVDHALGARSERIEVTEGGVKVAGSDERSLAQALYHLEDLMNLRRAPFLKKGFENRERLFSPRMTHSGYACDEFPDAHLKQIAHAGMDAILIFVKDIDKTKGHPRYQDIADTIRRAKAVGLDTYLYSYITAFAHPRDPGAAAAFENTFGRVSKAYPEAKGFVLVGESCEFPSKDPRVIPVEARSRGKEYEGDTRPMAGYFPCDDYHEWLGAVKDAVRKYNPGADIVFWTYNWGSAPYEPRMRLIDRLPKDVPLMATWEMFEDYTLPNGYTGKCNDYTLAFEGPGKYFTSEAVRAKQNGLRLYAMSNTGGLTWDYGAIPYMPTPYRWKQRWDNMRKAHADWGLCGLMEDHHYGWHPSFVSELAKEAFTRGGIPFDEHIRKIAARDFGAENADAVVKAWKGWSTALTMQPATHANQYSIFRAGPAYPFNALGPRIRDPFSCGKEADPTLPFCDYAANGARICRLNYADDQIRQWVEGLDYFPRLNPSAGEVRLETESLDAAAKLYLDGVKVLRDAAATLPEGARRTRAEKIAGIGEFMGRTCLTAAAVTKATKLEDAVLSDKTTDAAKDAAKAEIHALARAEYANAKAALKVLEFDSSLGWEPTMEYIGGIEQMKWKLRRMEELYGEKVK